MGQYYFRHDATARDDEKIVDLEIKYGSHKGYALYFMTLEVMCEADSHHILPCKVNAIAYRLHMQGVEYLGFLETCVEIDLFSKDGVGYYSERFVEEMEKAADKSRKRSKASKTRWNKESDAAPAAPEPELKKEDGKPKPKRKPSTENTPAKYQAIFDHWNSKGIVVHGKVTAEMKKAIDKRLKEFTPEQIMESIDHYKNAVTTEEFWQSRSKEWTLDMFISRQNGMPKFLVWETKIKPDGSTGNPAKPTGYFTQEDVDKIIEVNKTRAQFGHKLCIVPEVGSAR